MPVYNLARLQDEAATRVRNSAISDAQWTIWANAAQAEVASKIDLPSLSYSVALSTVDGTRSYYLDEFLPGSIVKIVDETNERDLIEVDDTDLVRKDLDRDEEGAPTHYSCDGIFTVEAQPSAATVVSAVSASASDTTQKVMVRGLVSGALDYELITLTGTTQVSTTKQFSELFQVSKDAVTVGKITVKSATQTFSVIPRAELATEYLRINCYPVPDAVYTMRSYGYRRPMELVSSEDFSELPVDFHELIVFGMQKRAHDSLYDFDRGDKLQAYIDYKIRELVNYASRKANYVPRLKGRPRRDVVSVGRFPSEFENYEY